MEDLANFRAENGSHSQHGVYLETEKILKSWNVIAARLASLSLVIYILKRYFIFL